MLHRGSSHLFAPPLLIYAVSHPSLSSVFPYGHFDYPKRNIGLTLVSPAPVVWLGNLTAGYQSEMAFGDSWEVTVRLFFGMDVTFRHRLA